ncbi:hypothetical protein [Vibrio phage RYC]|nr:hypothetical protein [Vibrio phage RYC]
MKTDTTFDHWNTDPVPVKYAYVPEEMTLEEYRAKMEVERDGDELFTHGVTMHFEDVKG